MVYSIHNVDKLTTEDFRKQNKPRRVSIENVESLVPQSYFHVTENKVVVFHDKDNNPLYEVTDSPENNYADENGLIDTIKDVKTGKTYTRDQLDPATFDTLNQKCREYFEHLNKIRLPDPKDSLEHQIPDLFEQIQLAPVGRPDFASARRE
jgi:hypothetical protein